MTEDELVKFAERVFVIANAADKSRDAVTRTTLRARRQAPFFTIEARQAAALRLEREIGVLEVRRPCEPGTWTPRVELARELGVTSVRLGRWLDRGRVPQDFMHVYAGWAARKADAELQLIVRRAKLIDLIEQARTPQYQEGAASGVRRLAVQAPDIKTSERRTESEDQSGYMWTLNVEQWTTWPLVERLGEWARTRRHPKGFIVGRYWLVTALASVYAHQLRSSRRLKGRLKSPGGFRQFAKQSDAAIARELSIKVPISSRTVTHGGLERAARLFHEMLTIEHCDQELVFIHGMVIRNWRQRNAEEKANYRARLFDQAVREMDEKAKKDARRVEAARKGIRKKVTERVKKSRAVKGSRKP